VIIHTTFVPGSRRRESSTTYRPVSIASRRSAPNESLAVRPCDDLAGNPAHPAINNAAVSAEIAVVARTTGYGKSFLSQFSRSL
jgi:hypothetical protein